MTEQLECGGSELGGAELNFRSNNYIAGLSAVLLGHVKTRFGGAQCSFCMQITRIFLSC